MGLITAAVGAATAIGTAAVAAAPYVKAAGQVYSAVQGATAFSGAKKAGKKQERAIESQEDIVKSQYDFYQEFYQPLEERVVREAHGGIDPEYFADRAGFDVRQQFDKARGSYERDFGRLGIDPSSGQFADQLADLRLAQASAEAGARTKARSGVIYDNLARRQQVAGLGRNIPSQTITGMRSLAGQYGQQAAAEGQSAGSLFELAATAPQVIGDIFGGGGGGTTVPQPKTAIPVNQRVGTLAQSAQPGSTFKSKYL